MRGILIVHNLVYKNERRQVNKKSFEFYKDGIKKERRQDRDGKYMCAMS